MPHAFAEATADFLLSIGAPLGGGLSTDLTILNLRNSAERNRMAVQWVLENA